MKLLPSKDEVLELRSHVSSNISKFSKDNAHFTKEFETHLEIIRRYDEVISEKASKMALYE